MLWFLLWFLSALLIGGVPKTKYYNFRSAKLAGSSSWEWRNAKFNRFFGENLMPQNPINKLNLIRSAIRKTNALKTAQTTTLRQQKQTIVC